jgi:hypothetical protein
MIFEKNQNEGENQINSEKPIESNLEEININNINHLNLKENKVNIHQNNIDKDNKKIDNEVIALSRTKRCWFYLLVMGINLLINLENGTVPSATDKIQNDMKIDEEALGFFGSFVFLGSLIGKQL